MLCQTNIYTQNDSLAIVQIKSLNGICREISELGNEVRKIDSTRFSKNSNYIEVGINTQTLIKESLKELKPKEDTKSLLDFLYNSVADFFGAFLGAGIGLYLFFKGLKSENEKARKAKIEEQDQKAKYLKTTLKSTISLTDKYHLAINEFADSIEKDPLYIESLKLYPLQVYNRLQKIIDNESYYHAFVSKYGDTEDTRKSYAKISSSSDFLASQLEQLYIRDYEEKDFARKSKYKIMFNELSNEIHEVGLQAQNQVPKLFTDIEVVLSKYKAGLSKEKMMDLEYHQTTLIEPSLILINDDYFEIQGIRPLLYRLKEASQLFNDIKAQNLHVAEGFKDHFKVLNEVNDLLKEELKKLG